MPRMRHICRGTRHWPDPAHYVNPTTLCWPDVPEIDLYFGESGEAYGWHIVQDDDKRYSSFGGLVMLCPDCYKHWLEETKNNGTIPQI